MGTVRKDILIIALTFLIFGGGSLIILKFRNEETQKPQLNQVATDKAESMEEPEETKDEVAALLDSLSNNTSIDFSGPIDITFEWNIEGEKEGKVTKIETLGVNGKRIKASEISNDQDREITMLFKRVGFEVDVYNVAAGTVSGATGYKKDTMVCLVTTIISGFDPETEKIPTQTDKNDIEISCGKLESNKKQTMYTKPGDKFSVELDSNPTTGYEWNAEVDSNYIKLIDKAFTAGANSEGLVGAGGTEKFNFEALLPGQTEITFFYKRRWEEKEIEQQIYEIIIE